MNLQKAMEIGLQYRRDGEVHDLQDFEDFVDLGIEALKIVKFTRANNFRMPLGLLPGETEDSSPT